MNIKKNNPMLSVVIATYNRSDDLKLVLDCLQKQELPNQVEFEVLIIDNNSNDDTKSVVESFMSSFRGRLKYLFEEKQGKPFALNLGIQETKGDIIVLTDDDCTFDNDYLAKIYEVFEKNGESVGFIGGKCLPRWVNCSKPQWLVDLKPGWWFKEFFWGPIAILDYGNEPFVLESSDMEKAKGRLFYGANMAVRKSFFQKYNHKFLTPPVEDVELQLHLLQRNMLGFYTPNIVVYHKVSASRATPQHYYNWYFLRGTLLEIQENYQKKFYHPFGIRWALIAETFKLWMGSILARSMTEKIYKRSHALFNLGQMKQIASGSPVLGVQK